MELQRKSDVGSTGTREDVIAVQVLLANTGPSAGTQTGAVASRERARTRSAWAASNLASEEPSRAVDTPADDKNTSLKTTISERGNDLWPSRPTIDQAAALGTLPVKPNGQTERV